jgi:hypothetical protein
MNTRKILPESEQLMYNKNINYNIQNNQKNNFVKNLVNTRIKTQNQKKSKLLKPVLVAVYILYILVCLPMTFGQALPDCSAYQDARSYSGVCNNLLDPLIGSTGKSYTFLAVGSEDRLNDLNLPNERTISNHLFASYDAPLSNTSVSMLSVFFGQFITHDLTGNGVDGSTYTITLDEPYDIFHLVNNITYMNISRSYFVNDSLVNYQSSFLDLSGVYGYDSYANNKLRSYQNGLMKVHNYTICSYDGMPKPYGNGTCIEPYSYILGPPTEKETNLPNDLGRNDFNQPKHLLMSCGDYRCNENIGLSLMHIIFLREHNRLARDIKTKNPGYTDEQIFQEARKLNIAVYQHVVMDEYTRDLIGENYYATIKNNYTGYDNSSDPRTSVPFATAAFRYGHSSIRAYKTLTSEGCPVNVIPEPWFPFPIDPYLAPFLGSLGPEGFTSIELIQRVGGIQNLLYALSYQLAGDIDNAIDDGFRNLGLGFDPLDIFAADIARGRMNKLPNYHALRAFFHEPIYGQPGCPGSNNSSESDPLECFLKITSNITGAQKLKNHYFRIDRIDGFVGMLFEDHEMDCAMGPTAAKIIVEEYERKRNADRFWYERSGMFSEAEMQFIQSRTMVDIANDNLGTSIKSFFKTSPMPSCPKSSTTSSKSQPTAHSSGQSTKSENSKPNTDMDFDTNSSQLPNYLSVGLLTIAIVLFVV